MGRILLLEDDEMLSQTLISLLAMEGYEVKRAATGSEVFERTFEEKFDLYLFDVNVPDENGFEVLSQLRGAGDTTPTFFITALSDIGSLARGFEVGANDYIKKPFDLDEFLIRIRAVLKRVHKKVRYGDIVFVPETGEILRNGGECDLSPVERSVFALLIGNIERTVPKEMFYELMEKPSDTALRVYIAHLKQKLDLKIVNIRSVGYRLESA